MKVKVRKNKRHGGDDYYDDIALGFEEIREHGDEEQYTEQNSEEAPFVRERETDKTCDHLKGAAAI